MGNPFVHVELVTTDVAKAKSFYGKLFKWKLEDLDMGDMNYTLTGGGLMKNPMRDGHSTWIAYVANVKKATQKSEISWGQDQERRNRGQRCRFAQHHHGPNRRLARPLGAEEENKKS